MKKEPREVFSEKDKELIVDRTLPVEVAGHIMGLSKAAVIKRRNMQKEKYRKMYARVSQRIRDKMKKENEERFSQKNACYSFWKEEEIEYIMTSKEPDREIARKLNKTVYAVQKKRARVRHKMEKRKKQ